MLDYVISVFGDVCTDYLDVFSCFLESHVPCGNLIVESVGGSDEVASVVLMAELNAW